MSRLNIYLLKKACVTIGGLVVFACMVLLMERLLRIFEVVSNSNNPAGDASSMIINLLPYYLGIAVPMALLLGIIITIDRFSRSSELTAAMGAGVSLFQMTKPFILIAIILSGITLFIEGYMQPVGRYNYREVAHIVKQQSFTAALREGTFTNIGNRTFFAGTDLEGSAIGPVFIHEQLSDNNGDSTREGLRLTTASEGKLIVREETQDPVLQLEAGQTYQILNGRQLSGDLSFEKSAIAGAHSLNRFRARGDDEREMTSMELYANRKGEVTDNVSVEENNAMLHLRLSRSALLLILPFIAVPFGLNYGRNPSSAGIFIGVVMLVSLQKALEFAQSLGADGKIPPWLGIWGIIAVLAGFAAFIFWKSAFKMGQPPLTSFQHYLSHIQGEFRKKLTTLRTPKANAA